MSDKEIDSNNDEIESIYDSDEHKSYQSKDGYKLEDLVEMINIADILSDEQLEALGEKAKREYLKDKETRTDREERMDRAMDLAMLIVKEKNYPFPGAANVIFPLLTTAVLQFAARSLPAIIPSTGIVKMKRIGNDETGQKQRVANRVVTYNNYQLQESMETWISDQDQLLHSLPVLGCIFKKTYYDVLTRENVSELIFPKNLIVDNNASCLEKAPAISHEIEVYPHNIIERQRAGIYLKYDIFAANDNNDNVEAAHIFIEQHRLLDLDNDGYPEPYIVTFNRDTAEVVRIVARFEVEDIEYNDKQEVVRIVPTHYFTKYEFMPSPDGSFYSLGLGELLYPLNGVINSTINQLMDAGHLQNTGGGFIGKGLRLKAGNLAFRPNEWKVVNTIGDDIRRNIVPLPVPVPSNVLFQLLGLLIDAGKDMSSVKDILTGESQGANASPTTTIALIEQGLKVFNAIYQRIHSSLKKELAKLQRLNFLYLDEEKYREITDDPESVRGDFDSRFCDIVPVSDPGQATDIQKSAKAQFLLQFIQDPTINRREVYRRVFESFNIENIQDLFLEEQPAQPDPALELAILKQENEREKIEIEREKNQILGEKALAEIGKIKAEALAAIAKAENLEVGNQLSIYKAELEAIMTDANMSRERAEEELITKPEETNENINTGGVQGLEGVGSNTNNFA